jgi:Domain of unknown function (DUF397)
MATRLSRRWPGCARGPLRRKWRARYAVEEVKLQRCGGNSCVEVGEWRKSSYSFSNGNCVEVGRDQLIFVRDTQQDGAGPVLAFPPGAWTAFTASLKAAGLSLPDGPGMPDISPPGNPTAPAYATAGSALAGVVLWALSTYAFPAGVPGAIQGACWIIVPSAVGFVTSVLTRKYASQPGGASAPVPVAGKEPGA